MKTPNNVLAHLGELTWVREPDWPSDPYAEQVVIGWLLSNPHMVSQVTGLPEPEHFTSEQNRGVFKAILEASKCGDFVENPDPFDTVLEYCREGGYAEDVDGDNLNYYIGQVPNHVSTCDHYSAVVKRKHMLRGLFQLALSLLVSITYIDLGKEQGEHREDNDGSAIRAARLAASWLTRQIGPFSYPVSTDPRRASAAAAEALARVESIIGEAAKSLQPSASPSGGSAPAPASSLAERPAEMTLVNCYATITSALRRGIDELMGVYPELVVVKDALDAAAQQADSTLDLADPRELSRLPGLLPRRGIEAYISRISLHSGAAFSLPIVRDILKHSGAGLTDEDKKSLDAVGRYLDAALRKAEGEHLEADGLLAQIVGVEHSADGEIVVVEQERGK